MITNIHIENFKSIQSLDLELGRLNIFIGANGSGKSNILEAIAMGSAAMEDKLDDEFLYNRGLRVTEPKLVKSGFDPKWINKNVSINFSIADSIWNLELSTQDENLFKWITKGGLKGNLDTANKLREDLENSTITLKSNLKEVEGLKLEIERLKLEHNDGKRVEIDSILSKVDEQLMEFEKSLLHQNEKFGNEYIDSISRKISTAGKILNFLIYAPENHFLRRFEEEAAIKPLGIKGEGLFKLFTIIEKEYSEQFDEILKYLELIDWFESVEIPKDLQFTERRIKIKDRYLAEGLQYFDQRSANEGFLYLLFYLTLFVSDLTPHFFAIDNIDNSLNPKLGSELIKVLAQLAKKHNKQALLTTHNPVILDGLDLEDDDQRLFVVYRNADGHTKVRRVPPRKPVNGVEQVRLSEAFIRGYIGGIPDNF